MKKLICGLLTLVSFSALATENNMMMRMRAINVMPDEKGSPSIVGGDVKLNNVSVPEVDFTYFFSKNIAAELILATATHKASAYKTSLNNLDLGDVSLLPPTLLVQYHHEFESFKPYVGAGINYTIFYGEYTGVAKNVSYDNNVGYAFQVGGDYQVAENLFINFDVKKLFLSTDVEVETYSNGSVKANVYIDPYIVALGFGFKF